MGFYFYDFLPLETVSTNVSCCSAIKDMTIQLNGSGLVGHQERQILLYSSSEVIWRYDIWILFHEIMEQIREALPLTVSAAAWGGKAGKL